MNACKNYPSLSNSRRITWEYVMIDNVNDPEQDAINLVKLFIWHTLKNKSNTI